MAGDFHYVALRTTAHATEDVQKVEQALRFFAGDDAPVNVTDLEGHHKNPIRLMEVELKRNADITAFWKRVAAIPGAVKVLRSELDRRMDDDLNFYLRLAKQEAFLGEARLARDEDAIHARAKVAVFPKRLDVAREKMAAYLDGLHE